MNAQQEARVNMFYATTQVLEENNSVWSATPAMVTLKTEFDANIETVEAVLAIQVKDITGHTKAKAASAEKMISKSLQVAGAAMAYAEATKNPGLAEEMNISASELRNYRDAVVAQRCQGVHSAGTANLAALAGYGVVAADLTELQANIDSYLSLVASPRTKIVTRSTKTAELGTLIRDTSKLLDRRMDMVMRGFMTSQPEFFSEYTKARMIIDPASQKGVEEKKVA